MNDRPAPSNLLPVSYRVQLCVWLLVTGLAVVCEIPRWMTPAARLSSLSSWLCGQGDWLPFIPWLLLGPLIGLKLPIRVRRKFDSNWQYWLKRSAGQSGGWLGNLIASVLLFCTALWMSSDVAQRFAPPAAPGQYAPAYHDEFSYLYQAETFLQRRFTNPAFPEAPELFDQIHVLNEGTAASRYFPGTGAWLAPFVDLGDPWLGQRLAHALIALLIFWIGRELSSNRVGLLASGLYALAPGPLLFSSLLLSHQPTLLGLMVFLLAFLRWQRTNSLLMTWIAGVGLSFAMLCRPMTAAGFGLPFGIVFASWWLTGKPRFDGLPPSTTLVRRSLRAVLLGLPLVAGIGCMLFYNQQVTGSAWKSPYQLYTDVYTPRHRYGFNNVTIGEQHLGPKVIENYDRWAENLTPELAARNVLVRSESSLRWSMGIVPLLLGSLVVLLSPHAGSTRWLLIFASIFSLHLVHIPYWFEGIMGWHYVYETAPLWILLFAESSFRLITTWRASNQGGLVWWWRGMILLAVIVNLRTVVPLWPGRLPQGVAEVKFSRDRYTQFWQQFNERRGTKPVALFVIPDPADRHIDFILNRPQLEEQVVFLRLNDRAHLERYQKLFPDRDVLIYDAAQKTFSSP
ncbi:ArnT family glycosyltransferase [Planctomicrobium sp. SH664]|uniref:ArnT family glycosyltransferase n=1 Tax=Planctomicrobium sp. SH664 TaxID=3448125 RepID=UPI003F5C5726